MLLRQGVRLVDASSEKQGNGNCPYLCVGDPGWAGLWGEHLCLPPGQRTALFPADGNPTPRRVRGVVPLPGMSQQSITCVRLAAPYHTILRHARPPHTHHDGSREQVAPEAAHAAIVALDRGSRVGTALGSGEGAWPMVALPWM